MLLITLLEVMPKPEHKDINLVQLPIFLCDWLLSTYMLLKVRSALQITPHLGWLSSGRGYL